MSGGTDAPAFLEGIRAFADGPVRENAQAWSMGESPDDLPFMQAAATGVLGTCIPREHGGQGHGFATLAQACEALAAVDFGFAMSLVNTHNVGRRLCLSAPPALVKRYLPGLLSGKISACTALTEPCAGSDFAAIRTRAVKDGEGWRLTGEKTWIVNARRAGLAVVFAHCGTSQGADGIGGFLVDLSLKGVRRYAIDSAFSQTSMGTGELVFSDVELEPDSLILAPGGAFKSILTEINAARAYVAAMSNAMLRAALGQAWDYGAIRETFGKLLAEHPSWRRALATAETELAASEALTARAVAQVERGENAQLAAAQAKIAAVETCQRRLPDLLHAMGAEGLRPEYCFTRHLAAIQSAALTDGATEILRERVARLTGPRTDKAGR